MSDVQHEERRPHPGAALGKNGAAHDRDEEARKNSQAALRAVSTEVAKRYGMEPAGLEQIVYETCCDGQLSFAEFAAFLLVAKEYSLNPITREIFAFKKKGGGIVPIVSVDGWISLINSHPDFDGMEFEEEHNEEGELVATTCALYRKSRSRPVKVKEYFDECKRNTEPWKMEHRMLRHKALIQCARYAFGFSGIYDEEEGRVIADAGASAKDITPPKREAPPAPPPPAKESGPTMDASQGSSPRAAEDQGGSRPTSLAAEGAIASDATLTASPDPEASAIPAPTAEELDDIPAAFERRPGRSAAPYDPRNARETAEDAEEVEEEEPDEIMGPGQFSQYLDNLQGLYEEAETLDEVEKIKEAVDDAGKPRMAPPDYAKTVLLYSEARARVLLPRT